MVTCTGSSVFNFLGIPFDLPNTVCCSREAKFGSTCQLSLGNCGQSVAEKAAKVKKAKDLIYIGPRLSQILRLLDLPLSWVDRHLDCLDRDTLYQEMV